MKALIQTAGLMTALWGIPIPLAGLGMSAAVWATPVKTPAKNVALQKLFRQGMDAYEAKSYDDAVAFFSQLLQKQPDYIPAKIQLARALYQLKRYPESYKLFQQVEDISILTPDPSYEYGQAAFRANDYANALKAFRNVPNGHPLFDLAGYYGGIAAFKQGDYQLSLDLFEQAVVLPSKLLKPQKLYQKEAERLLIIKQKQELQNSVPPVVNRPIGAPPVEAVEAPKPFRYLAAQRRVQLIPRFTLQSREALDKQTSDHTIVGGAFDLRMGIERNAAAQEAPHWIFQADIAALSMEGGSTEVLALPDARTEQDRFVVQKSQARSLYSFGAGAAVEWSMGVGTSLGLQLGARGLVPEGSDRPQGASLPHFGLFLAQKNNSLETLLRADFYGTIYDGDFLASNARQLGRVEYDATNRIHIALQGELSEYSYNVDRVNGPDWQGRILSEIGYAYDQAFRLSLGAFFEITEAQRFHDVGEVLEFEFNANAFGARVRSDFNVMKSIDLGLEAWTMDRSVAALNPNNENTRPAQSAVFPAVITNVTFHINIHTDF